MADHWPILVGINQYQALQPLMYAQFDAIELKDFLVNEARLPAAQCTLLTDVSPMVYQAAAYPTREAILQQLSRTCQAAAPDDLIWFFFSGYGLHWEGQDLLLPIDADSQHLPDTAIPLQTIFEALKQSPTQHTLVMLDMNRSQSALPNQQLGSQTLELARSLDIPLILSCRPDQFSQETLAVRHGLFSQAVLEGLRFHGCLTLAQLVAYLTERVPELCGHHWRPVQNPVAMVPAHHQFQLLLPPSVVTHLGGSGQETIATPIPQPLATAAIASRPGFGTTDPGAGQATDPALIPDAASVRGDGTAPPPAVLATATSSETLAPETAGPETSGPETPTSAGSLAPWLQWGLLGAGLLLMLGVVLRNQPSLFRTDPKAPMGETPAVDAPAPGGTAPGDKDASPSADPASPEQPPTYQNGDQPGQPALDSARMIIEPVSASLFNDAIERARQVPQDDPYYDQAMADINRWSQVILDLAEGRAVTGNYDQAIAAARLVPDDTGTIYQTAQARIQDWQHQQTSEQILQQAQTLLVPDQATSFADAIALVQQIPANSPTAELAQKRIDQWSQDILVIARARAAAGQYPGAISAAQLVPSGTSAYGQAQQEIQRWQQP